MYFYSLVSTCCLFSILWHRLVLQLCIMQHVDGGDLWIKSDVTEKRSYLTPYKKEKNNAFSPLPHAVTHFLGPIFKEVLFFYLERPVMPTLDQMQSRPWISPRCPHISMSAGVVMKSARASCCPCSREPVSSWVTGASSDTVFLKLQNTHRDNGTQVGHTWNRHRHIYSPYIKQTDRQGTRALRHFWFRGCYGKNMTVADKTGQTLFFSVQQVLLQLHIYMTCFGNLEKTLTFHMYTSNSRWYARGLGLKMSIYKWMYTNKLDSTVFNREIVFVKALLETVVYHITNIWFNIDQSNYISIKGAQ